MFEKLRRGNSLKLKVEIFPRLEIFLVVRCVFRFEFGLPEKEKETQNIKR